jgi:peptide deformylase
MKKTRRRPVVPQILTDGDPRLKEESEVCHEIDVKPITQALFQALTKARNGVGIAAPQLGIMKRVILVNNLANPLFMVNPRILHTSHDMIVSRTEGCLSYPGKYVPVERPWSIDILYEDVDYNSHFAEFDGLTARIIQHEIDHLDGICKVGDGNGI